MVTLELILPYYWVRVFFTILLDTLWIISFPYSFRWFSPDFGQFSSHAYIDGTLKSDSESHSVVSKSATPWTV